MIENESQFNLKETASALEKLLSGTESVRMHEPMSLHTSFRAGGEADLFVETGVMNLCPVLQMLKKDNIPFVILGNGSNILVSDAGYRGAVVHLCEQTTGIGIDGQLLTCDAGQRLSVVAHAAKEASLDGLAFAAGIPGTIGGALVMNAGAFGGEMKDIVESVTAIDLEKADMPEIHLSCAEMHFSYRHSLASEKALCITGVTLRLTAGNQEEIENRMREISQQRTEKQPLNYPSAGSTFKRPEGYFAGKLIMDAGLRGYSVGGAQVAEKHCGFIINKGGATATDIYRLMTQVQEKVYADSGVHLEREVILLGEFE